MILHIRHARCHSSHGDASLVLRRWPAAIALALFRATALSAALVFLGSCATDTVKHIATPTIGEQLSLPGSKVFAAELDANAVAAFVTQYLVSNGDTAWVLAQRAFNDDSLIPEESLASLRALLASSRTYPAKAGLITYSPRFRQGSEAGSRNGTLTIDWTNRMLVTESFSTMNVSGSPPIIASEKRSLLTALGHFKNHLVAEGLDPSKHRLTASYYGSRIIILSRWDLEPTVSPYLGPAQYYMDARLRRAVIYRLDAKTIGWLIDTEFHPITADKRLTAVHAYLQLHDPGAKLIDSVRSIPGYDKRPIDPDVRSAIRPTFEFVDRNTNFMFDVLVCYTYSKIGGVITRYRFAFHDGYLHEVSPLKVCENVGDAEYHQ